MVNSESDRHISPRQLGEARRNAVVRLFTYGDGDTSSKAAEKILEKGRPELRLTSRMIARLRRKHSGAILNKPRKHGV